uniref:MAK10-like protein n=1 Tax=Tanacetum cinerariifolium TaxID=118510 RepID=A0A6L2MLD4_TANCI|nr:MAK10-like protein [Tanacetum cinerariifolium]
MDFAKPVKFISLPQDVMCTSDHRLIELEHQVQRLMEAYIAPIQPTQVNKITSSCEIYSGPHETQYCMKNPMQAFVDYASSRIEEARGLVSNFMASQDARLLKFEADFKQQQSKMTNKIDTVLKAITDRMAGALPSDTVKSPKLNVNSTSPVLFTCSYPIEDPQCSSHPYNSISTKDPENPLLVGRGFLATANPVIDYRKAKIAVGEGITRKDFLEYHFPGEWEIARDTKINPFKDEPINWDKPPENRDGAWHAKIRLIDPDGEEFTKTLQPVPTSRKLSEKEDPRGLIFYQSYDNLYAMTALGWHLEEIHVTWAHLEKKRTRLRTSTKSLEELCKQCVETAAQASSDAVAIFLVTALGN